jgi:hypothetical protein
MTTYDQIVEDYKENFYGISSIAIIASTCLGSIAAMMSLFSGNGFLPMFLVFLSVVVCCAHLVAFLSVQKPRMILNLLILSLVVNTLLIILNSIFW